MKIGIIVGLLVLLSAVIGCAGDGGLEEIRLLQDKVSELEAENVILQDDLVIREESNSRIGSDTDIAFAFAVVRFLLPLFQPHCPSSGRLFQF